MNAVNKGNFAMIHVLGDRFVGSEHKFFDDGFGDCPQPFFKSNGSSLLIQENFDFRQVKINRATTLTLAAQDVGELFHGFQHGNQRRVLLTQGRIFPGKNPADNCVAEAGADANDTGIDLVAFDPAR